MDHNLFSLTDKRGLIIGIANEKSIAYGCAKILYAGGAKLAVTYLNDKAKPYVLPLAEAINAPIILPCNVENDSEMSALFETIHKEWGKLDFLIHSIAFAPKEDLQGRVTDCSRTGFLKAMDISCHSFIRMSKLAEPLMREGGSLLTITYYGSEKVVPHYALMGPVKAALEASVRYLAAELGHHNIRVNAISPGAIATRAASGIQDFSQLLEQSATKSPLKRLVTIEEVGYLASFLCSDAAQAITGGIHYIDAGYEIID